MLLYKSYSFADLIWRRLHATVNQQMVLKSICLELWPFFSLLTGITILFAWTKNKICLHDIYISEEFAFSLFQSDHQAHFFCQIPSFS